MGSSSTVDLTNMLIRSLSSIIRLSSPLSDPRTYNGIELCDTGRLGDTSLCQHSTHRLNRAALTHLLSPFYTCVCGPIFMSLDEARLLDSIIGIAKDNLPHIVETVRPMVVTKIHANISPLTRLLNR